MKFLKFFLVGLFGLLIVACGATAVTPTAAPPPPPPPPTADLAPPAVTEIEEPTAVAPATPTEQPVESPTDQPDNPPPAQSPTLEPGTMAPGQQIGDTLTEGQTIAYTFNGTKFQPVMFFVEGSPNADLALSAYDRPVMEPADQAPTTQADFSATGGPEIFVYTPQVDGTHTIAVTSKAGSGNFSLYMYDGVTSAPNAVVESGILAAGEIKTVTAVSNGGRPVLVYVDPTDQSNLAINIDGGTTSADYAGNGSAEALFLLPVETTTYQITISESNGGASTYNLVIVTL